MKSALQLDPSTPLDSVRGIGPARARALAAAGYGTVEDLLRFHLPHRYEDRREVRPIAEAAPGGAYTLRGRLSGLRRIRTRRRGFSVVRGRLEDASGALPVVWFNRPYLAEQTDAGAEYILYGPVREGNEGPELLNPSCERVEEGEEAGLHGGRIAPVYPAVGALGAPFFRRLMGQLAGALDLPRQVPERLPEEVLARHGLPRLGEALLAIHAPGPEADVEALCRRRSPAHLRLVYEELLDLQVRLALQRTAEEVPRTLFYRVDDALRNVARGVLPFRLTGAQKRALREIVADLQGGTPMLRLLQGDVGSGKTLVAALALVVALENGFQGAFMAPTELLAEQHFANLERLLGHRYRLGLFTGGAGDSATLRRRLAAGEVQLAVGTHALIQEGVEFRRLGLAVVDEQHRFGVAQRGLLRSKGGETDRPDLLVMTATPIPRSLALVAYGDLPVSVIDELPPGRLPIATEVVAGRQRAAVYRRLREELAAGGRAYIVFPRIEESEDGAASVEGLGEKVRASLEGFSTAVVHGRMPRTERDRAMRAFAAGEVQALLATTVIEVGVDVPEATWMVIESAERFGLAQLHQLRGRVGRGSRPSVCVALHGKLTADAKQRLEAFGATTDGFALAEADLAIRGPGDLLGTRQAGLPELRVADLSEHRDWLVQARDDARDLLGRLDGPALAALREAALAGGRVVGWEG
jgi:ATP-dependent DNA helicase RecG